MAIFMEFSFPLFRHFNLKCLHVLNSKCIEIMLIDEIDINWTNNEHETKRANNSFTLIIIIFWAPYNQPNRMLELKLECGVVNRTQNRQPNIWLSRLLKLLTCFTSKPRPQNATHFNLFIFSLMNTKLNMSQTIHFNALKKERKNSRN